MMYTHHVEQMFVLMHSDKIIAQYRSHLSPHINLIDIGINASIVF